VGYSGARGGLDAILAAEDLVRRLRDQAPAPWAPTEQVIARFRLAVDRVMGEAGLYDEDSAAAAFRQAEGDPLEAAHLLRAYRSTLPRLAFGEAVDPDELFILRRIVPAFRQPDGPQLLGRTTDYTGRMLEKPAAQPPPAPARTATGNGHPTNGRATNGRATDGVRTRTRAERHPRRFLDLLRELDLAVDHRDGTDPEPFDITRSPARPPAPRSAALAAMARAETGALVALWYRSILGPDGDLHEITLGEVRHGRLPLRVRHPHTGNPVTVGEFRVTEAEAIEDLDGVDEDRSRFDVGYGLCFGHNERKAIAMANLDIANRRFGRSGPLEQLLLLTTDGLDSGGFLEHLKLPHYVTFRSMVERKQALRAAAAAGDKEDEARLAEPVGRVC
jgi:alpha-D-ribose 1-methylphosphonate 5-triphosphate synthase subunit PhnI